MAGYQDGLAGICRRARKHKEEMRPWLIIWDELAHYFHHTRKGFVVDQSPGQELAEDLWNSTPEEARRKETEAMVSAMIPKDRMWPGLAPARGELRNVKAVLEWCQIAALYMYTVLYDPLCNWTERFNELADDVKSFGTGVIYIDHDRAKGHLTFMVPHLKNFAFEMDAHGNLTRTYCFWNMSLDDLVTQFGMEALPADMQEEARKDNCSTAKDKCVVHAIIPSDDYARFGLAPGRLPFRSMWILEKGCKLLDEKGYYEIPYVVVKWFSKSGEVPGRTDCMQMLPDARLLQAVSAALLEITEKQGNPPMQGPIDILRGDIELWPGGFTPFDASGFQFQGDPLRPVQIGANPAMTAEYLQYLEGKIKKGFHNDILSLPEDGGKMGPEDMLARELMKAMILAPIWSRVENEMLPPIMDRVFQIMLRARAFPPTPDELDGERLIYKFDNHISDMREAAEAQRITQGIAVSLQFEQPEAQENLDWDTAIVDLWRRMKVPEHYILPPEVVEAKRQQRQQLEQAAQMAEVAKAGGPGIKSMVEGAVTARDQGLIPAQ